MAPAAPSIAAVRTVIAADLPPAAAERLEDGDLAGLLGDERVHRGRDEEQGRDEREGRDDVQQRHRAAEASLPGPLTGGPGGGQPGDRVRPGLRGQVGPYLGDGPGLRGRGVVLEPEAQEVDAVHAAERFQGGQRGVEDGRAGAVGAGGRGQVHPGATDPQRDQRAVRRPELYRRADAEGVVSGPAVGRVGQHLARPGSRPLSSGTVSTVADARSPPAICTFWVPAADAAMVT